MGVWVWLMIFEVEDPGGSVEARNYDHSHMNRPLDRPGWRHLMCGLNEGGDQMENRKIDGSQVLARLGLASTRNLSSDGLKWSRLVSETGDARQEMLSGNSTLRLGKKKRLSVRSSRGLNCSMTLTAKPTRRGILGSAM